MAAKFASTWRVFLPIAASSIWACLLYVLATIPEVKNDSLINDGLLHHIPRKDLIVHFCAFGIFATLLRWAITAMCVPRPLSLSTHYTWPVIVSGSYGVGLEILQRHLPSRTGDPVDAIANIAGAVAFIALGTWVSNRRYR